MYYANATKSLVQYIKTKESFTTYFMANILLINVDAKILRETLGNK